ncbi:MAG: ECF transporter S component [Clostridia bacterium]|nr:ECF transporter S component [Clostridia bacterium]
MPPRQDKKELDKPQKLPWWRKLGALIFGAVSLAMFIYFTKGEGFIESPTPYIILIASLFGFALCVTRKSHRADYTVQTARDKRKLSKRTVTAAALILLMIPFTLFFGTEYLGGRKYYFTALLILFETMLPFFLIFEGRKPQARELVLIASLCAIAVAGRAIFFMLPNFKPVMALTIIAGVAFGGETGFLVGAVTMLVSNIMFSQGPWTPWQMFAMGIIGFLAGILFRKGWLRRTKTALAIFGALCGVVIYGGIMNPASALMVSRDLNAGVLMSYIVTGFPMDCVHGASTALFLWIAAEPFLEKLDRIKVKYGLVE